MPMEEVLVARLTGDPVLGPLVGESVSWFDRQRGDPLPAIVLLKVSPGRDWDQRGPDGLDQPRVRADIYADAAEQAVTIQRALTGLLQYGQDIDGVRFHPAQLIAERWLSEGEQDGGEALSRVQSEYVFFHEETE